jgi:glycosyltransferase involved in cell wall biosynthesis
LRLRGARVFTSTGVRAALDDGRAGVLVPPDDLEALVAAILRIDDEPDSRDRLARHGLQLADELTMENQAERALNLIGRSA